MLFGLGIKGSNFERLWLLGRVRVVGAGKYAQFFLHGAAQGTARHHTFDGEFQNGLGFLIQHFLQGQTLKMTDVTAVAVIHLILAFVSGDVNLFGVDHDDIVAGIHMWGVFGLVFAAQALGDLGSQSTKGLAVGVHDVPIAFYFGEFCTERVHLFIGNE